MIKGHSANSGGRDMDVARGFCVQRWKKGLLSSFIVIILALMMNVMIGGQVFAATNPTTLYKKALAGSLLGCYNQNQVKKSTVNDASEISDVKDVMSNSDGGVLIPNGYGNSLTDGDLSCAELFTGWEGFKTLFSGSASGLLGEDKDIGGSVLLDKLGYILIDASTVSSKCVSFDYNLNGDRHTNKLCYKINGDGTISPLDSVSFNGKKQEKDIKIEMSNGILSKWLRAHTNYKLGGYSSSYDLVEFSRKSISETDFEEMINTATSNFGGVQDHDVNPTNVKPNYEISESEKYAFSAYEIDSWYYAAERALKNLTSFNSFDEVKASKQEKYDLYIGYFKNVFNGVVSNSCSDNKNDSSESLPFSVDGGAKWCVVTGDKGSEEVVNIYTTDEDRYLRARVGYWGLIGAIRELSLDGVDLATADTATGGIGTTVTGDNKKDPCRDNSGSLGWIVCPVITWLGDTLNTIYDNMVEPLLKIDTNLVSSTGGTYEAWGVFRNIANVVFVILFLFVIFSQVTGVGIDNYGIKRILPKLIIAAVLINLSYIICQLLVDLSNIIGSGINVTLSDIASGLPSNMEVDFTSDAWFRHVVDTLLFAAGGAEIGAGVVLATSGLAISGIILPLLFSLFTALVSIVCFFALLGMRQAVVVVMVAIAPVSFVCYMLPNTKKIYDRWFKIFEAMLLLYPICGLIVGGSALASKIIIGSSKDFFTYLVGLLVLVVPFFFIPKIVIDSFNALGNIGARIMNAGSRFARRETGVADKAFKNSKGFQEREQNRKDKADLRRAERINERMKRRNDRGLSASEREELAKLRKAKENGEDYDAKRFSELSTKGLSEFQRKRLSNANAIIRESASNRDKARYGADESVLEGQMESDRYTNQRAAEEAKDWSQRFFRDKDGNVWTSDGTGNYTTVDRKTGERRTLAADRILDMVKEGEGQMVSKREAMANRDQVLRAKQTGQLTGYAASADMMRAASTGGRLSAAISSQGEIERDILSSHDSVLQVQHDEKIAKERELIGKAQARASLTESPVASTEVYTQRASNEYRLATAGNRIDVTPKISQTYADELVRSKYHTAQEKMFTEQLANRNKVQVMQDLVGAIMGSSVKIGGYEGSSAGVANAGDMDFIRAALRVGAQQGAEEEINKFLLSPDANRELALRPEIRNAISDQLVNIQSGEPAKIYGKFNAKLDVDKKMGYLDWWKASDVGIDADRDGKASGDGFLRARGEDALAGLGKDTIRLFTANPFMRQKLNPMQIMNAYKGADPNTRIAIDELLAVGIKEGKFKGGDMSPDDVKRNIIDGLSSTQWSTMDESTLRTILEVPESVDLGTVFATLPESLKAGLRKANGRLNTDGKMVKANMKGEVRKFFDSIS